MKKISILAIAIVVSISLLIRGRIMTLTQNRAPSMFIPHGGGPMPLMNDRMHDGMIKFLTGEARKYLKNNGELPKAIILVTAHWEESEPHISSAPKHELYYDYYGFPPETYKVKYPAPGEPSVAEKAAELLKKAGFSPKLDSKRGWDHGTFVPLKILLPEASVPIVQLSCLSSQDASMHLKMGNALEPLRDEGVAIIGSGMSFHNMSMLRRLMQGGSGFSNDKFEKALDEACEAEPQDRNLKLSNWESMPLSRECQPRGASEHLMPLFVAAGAGGNVRGKRVLDWSMGAVKLGSYLWK
ncbi:4,5-DOPA dioxygenase extradiol [Acrasis kona]|uniref:4,5-DOPA dioxygenase extradiol n=1 Tax=Acrasis kona TaxID=1008807 RepID=A0AAW2ZCS5_9EUKA